MKRIRSILENIDPLSDQDWDWDVIDALSSAPVSHDQSLHFHVPGFIRFHSTEISSCSQNTWPAVSITGGECALQCDHCKAEILKPMYPAHTPDELDRLVHGFISKGAMGLLLTGGSNIRNQVEYGPYYSTLRSIKDKYPDFRIAVHTALVDSDTAICLEQAGVDVAMFDMIGSQDTITQVYHLKRSVKDFEATLNALNRTSMKVVPHIVLGLHYGNMLGEWNALEIIRACGADALVLVVVKPIYAGDTRPFRTPDPHAIGRFFLEARQALPNLPVLLGCARPPGEARMKLDAYAVMAGLNGIAHPSEGIVELAEKLGRKTKISRTCCSMITEELSTDLDAITTANMTEAGYSFAGIPLEVNSK